MSGSILNHVKKMLGVANQDTTFDLDIATYINSAFSTLNDVGVGLETGFMVEDKNDVWDDFLGSDPVGLNQVKPFVVLHVRLLFDPPKTSFEIEAVERQKAEMLWRISNRREWLKNPVDPREREEETDDD